MSAIYRVIAALIVVIAASPTETSAQSAARVGPLHTVTLGAGSRTIVVLHGGPGFRHNYLRPEWDTLADSSTIVYYDQRGCGLSTHEGPHGWRQHVRDLDDLLSEISPNEPVILAGSSWGPIVALHYAYRYPERVAGLILSGAPTWPEPEVIKRYVATYSAATRDSLSVLAAQPLVSGQVIDSASVITRYSGMRPEVLMRMGNHCVGAYRAHGYSYVEGIALDSLKRLTVPILLLRGSSDTGAAQGAAAFSRVLPNAEVVVIEGAGHDPWADRPREFFTAVRRFLAKHRLQF